MDAEKKGLPRTADHLFESEGGAAELDLGLSEAPTPELFDLTVRTLGGDEILVTGVSRETTLVDVRLQVAEKLSSPPFTLKLVLDGEVLSNGAQTLQDIGLADQSAQALLLVRCPADRKEWVNLFRQLVDAIERRQPQEARRLVDLGAGLDGDGNVLKKSREMVRPGDWTAGEAEVANTMLHLAIREHLADLALYLLSRGIDVNEKNDVGRTPLIQAVLKKQEQLVAMILQAGPEIETLDYMQLSALDYALRGGDDKVAVQLVAASDEAARRAAFVHLVSHPPVPTALLKCCANGMPLTARAILEDAGTSIDASDPQARTALHYAYASMPELVGPLLEAGADPGVKDCFGRLPHEALCALGATFGAGAGAAEEPPKGAEKQCLLMKLLGF